MLDGGEEQETSAGREEAAGAREDERSEVSMKEAKVRGGTETEVPEEEEEEDDPNKNEEMER